MRGRLNQDRPGEQVGLVPLYVGGLENDVDYFCPFHLLLLTGCRCNLQAWREGVVRKGAHPMFVYSSCGLAFSTGVPLLSCVGDGISSSSVVWFILERVNGY